MSYKIAFKAKALGDGRWFDAYDCSANVTWNVREIIELSTGLPWINEANNGLCKDVIPHIERGLQELEAHGDEYKKYESPNGWGTVEGTKNFFRWVLGEWNDFAAKSPALADVSSFWIV